MLAFVRKWFWVGCGAVGIGVIVLALLGSGWLGFRLFQLEWTPQGQTDLRMRAAPIAFENQTDISEHTGSLPFMAGVIIDIDGDFRDEVFLGGGRGQADGLFRYDDALGAFANISADHDLSKATDDATMGGAAIDVNGDGTTDLLVARESGIWLYLNHGGRLSGARLPLAIDPTTTPVSIALGDVNKDGRVDFYVSGYLRNALVEGQTVFNRPYGGYSQFFLNVGALQWEDATRAYGFWRQHNTFTAVFADLDNDADSDLVVAQDTGVVETYENTGAPPFRRIANPSVNSYPMGIAAGDFNGDGLLDLYFSNVGHTLPRQLLRGDLPGDAPFNPDYMLFQNGGELAFRDVAAERGAAHIGFGWGVVGADMDLDGWEDLIIAQNYAKFGQPAIIHRYSGRILQNYAGARFRPVEQRAGAANPLFAISPLVGDFNGDQLPDLVWANLRGPARAFINVTPGRRAIAIRLDNDATTLNARILVTAGGRTLTRQIVASQGLSAGQSAKLMIGLGAAARAERVSVIFADGRTVSTDDVAAGSVVDMRRARP